MDRGCNCDQLQHQNLHPHQNNYRNSHILANSKYQGQGPTAVRLLLGQINCAPQAARLFLWFAPPPLQVADTAVRDA